MGRASIALSGLCHRADAAGTDRVPAYERRFAETVLGDADVPAVAFWRGRVTLWAMLRALDVTEADEVVVPAFTCEMVPAAVRFAGATPVYADVAPGTCDASPETAAACLSPATRAVLCQHTYGVPQPMAAWERLADEAAGGRGATLIEDCCQLIQVGQDEGRPGRMGAAAFFSSQWSKPYSTGLGGVAVFRDRALGEKVRAIRDGFPREGDRGRARSLAFQVLLYALTVRPWTRATVAFLYRAAQRAGLVRGTTTREEYGETMPEDYAARGLNIQADLGCAELDRWAENVTHRTALTRLVLEGLARTGADLRHLPAADTAGPLWTVPVFVENRDEMLHLASRRSLPLATWFDVPPAHVAPATAARYAYRPGQCPGAEWLLPREIHLTTGPPTSAARAEAAIRLLERHAQWSTGGAWTEGAS